MPKQYLVYRDFSGGLNSKTNARELRPNELMQAEGVVCDEIGSIRTVSPQSADKTVTDHGAAIKPGRGLFSFKSDYSYSSTANTFQSRESEYIVISDKDNSDFDMLGYDDNGDDHVLTSGLCDLGTGTVCEAVFYYADGALRYSDGSFDSRNRVKWFGRIGNDAKKKLLGVELDREWRDFNNSLDAPTLGLVAPSLSGTATGDTTSLIHSADAVSSGPIAAISDGGDGTTSINDASHGLDVNDVITIYGTTNYNGEHTVVEDTDTNNFKINIVFSESETTGNWVKNASADNFQGWSTAVSSANSNSRWLVAYDVGNNDVWKITSVAEATEDLTTSTNSSNWNGRSFDIYPFPGDGILLEAYQSEGSEEGAWEEGEYEFAQSFIYEGNQESKLKKLEGNNVQINSNEVLYVRVHVSGLSNDGENNTYIDSRLIGGRVYIRKSGTNNFWGLLIDMDFRVHNDLTGGGTRASTIDDYDDWASNVDADTGGENMGWTDEYFEGFKSTQYTIKRLSPESYENINGFSSSEHILSFGQSSGYHYKTAVVAGTRVFVANVHYIDPNTGLKAIMGDAIFYTPVGKYDTFPSSYKLEIAGNDGDEFTALSYHNGVLFAFKKNSLYMIDVSNIGNDASWRLINKYEGMGVTGQWGVVSTNFGIAWISKSGLYLSEGRFPTNLILEKISYEDWISFYDTGSFGPALGYDSSSNKLIMTDDVDDQDSVKIYDIALKTWTNGYSLTANPYWGIPGGADTSISNMITFIGNEIQNSGNANINRHGGILVYADENTSGSNDCDLFTISLAETTESAFVITTRDEDFGAPQLFKKIYEVNIEYLTDNSSDAIDVRYEIDGNDVPNSSSNVLATNQTLSGVSDMDNVNILNIKPSSPIKCRSISLRLQSYGTTKSTLKIKSIGIRYRVIRGSSIGTETSSS